MATAVRSGSDSLCPLAVHLARHRTDTICVTAEGRARGMGSPGASVGLGWQVVRGARGVPETAGHQYLPLLGGMLCFVCDTDSRLLLICFSGQDSGCVPYHRCH